MDDSVTVREFELLAHRLGIEIRCTADGPSGLCTLKGKKVFFIERGLDLSSRVSLFVREFKTLDLDGIFVVPLIRKLLDLHDESQDW
ncbi:hypothetical protein LLG96_15250 [bacterium]|nr:hypothetical protein [bacterium]